MANDLTKIKEMTEQFRGLYQVEKDLRKELSTVGDDIRYEEKQLHAIDSKVTDGTLFVGSLRAQTKMLEDLKKKRDEISGRLEAAVIEKERYGESIRPKIADILYRRYKEMDAAESVLRSHAIDMQKMGTEISFCAGLQMDVVIASPVCSGASVTLTDKDRNYFESLNNKGE
jgi:hypothetical protein